MRRDFLSQILDAFDESRIQFSELLYEYQPWYSWFQGKKGFDAQDEGEKPKWLDFCVVQSIFGGPTLPCDWIEVRSRTAHLKNESIGHLVGSES